MDYTFYSTHITEEESQPWELRLGSRRGKSEGGQGSPPHHSWGTEPAVGQTGFGVGLARTCAEAQSRRKIRVSQEQGAAPPNRNGEQRMVMAACGQGPLTPGTPGDLESCIWTSILLDVSTRSSAAALHCPPPASSSCFTTRPGPRCCGPCTACCTPPLPSC